MKLGQRRFLEPHVLGLVLWAFQLPGCQKERSTELPHTLGTHTVQRYAGRPALQLIERAGDPFSGVSYVVAHGLQGIQAASLADWLEYRIGEEKLPRFRVQVDAVDLKLDALISTPAEATRFVDFVGRTLRVDAVAPSGYVPSSRLKLDSLPIVEPDSAAAAVYRCGHESFATTTTRIPLGESALGPVIAFVSNLPSALGVVGSADVLNAARDAITRLPTREPRPLTPSHATQTFALTHSNTELSRLRVALFTSSLAQAFELARLAESGESPLLSLIASQKPDWRSEKPRVATLPGGACLSLNWFTANSVSLEDASFALKSAFALTNLAGTSPSSVAGEPVAASTTDPRTLASEVASRLVAESSPALAPGMAAILETPTASPQLTRQAEFSITTMLQELEHRALSVEPRALSEMGQPEFWMLVGSACSAQPSSMLNVASDTLWLRALSSRFSEVDGVRLEPWFSTRGSGVFGHAQRRTPDESPNQLATRVARSLGKVLTSSSLGAQDFGVARANQQAFLSKSADSGWWWWLDELTAEQPWRLAPQTTPETLAGLALGPLTSHRALFLAEPLRVVTLSNLAVSQPEAALTELRDWLLPYAPGSLKCRESGVPSWKLGEYRVPRTIPHSRSTVYLVLPVSPIAPRLARLTTLLLNRSLARTFESELDGSAVHAASFDAATSSVIVVSITAPPSELSHATAKVRSALQGLALAVVTPHDLNWAEQRLSALDRVRRLDPRVRLAETWAAVPERTPSPGTLQATLRLFSPERQLVVLPAGQTP